VTENNRREFLQGLAAATGGFVLMPVVSACKPQGATKTPAKAGATTKPTGKMPSVPVAEPKAWNAVKFNKERGNAGAIPKTYHGSINGAGGDNKHLGKHLPYQPKLDAKLIPGGYIALMWGDPAKGHAKHPNAPKSEKNTEGHWYNWIRVRKAAEGKAEELQSTYSNWPGTGDKDNGKYVAFGGGKVEDDSGKNTVYLTKLPGDVKKGDKIRVWAHCLTHGEYVDFLTV
jgi:hypothetical protein